MTQIPQALLESTYVTLFLLRSQTKDPKDYDHLAHTSNLIVSRMEMETWTRAIKLRDELTQNV